jgi:proline utilization trans-activator
LKRSDKKIRCPPNQHRAYCYASVTRAMRQPPEVLPYSNHFAASRQFVCIFHTFPCFLLPIKSRSTQPAETAANAPPQARYGFFDLDATFSAAFVLVMVGFLDKSQINPPGALDQASKVLHFLSRSGNLAAERRLQDIAQSCSHVWPSYIFNNSAPRSDIATNNTHNVTDNSGSRPDLSSSTSDPSPSMTIPSTSHGDYRIETGLLDPWSSMALPDTTFDMQGDWDLDLSGEAEGIYSSFHNPTLPLTGVDYVDWLEIEKVFNGP